MLIHVSEREMIDKKIASLTTRTNFHLTYGPRFTAEQIDHSEERVPERFADLWPGIFIFNARSVDQVQHAIQKAVVGFLLFESAFAVPRIVEIAAVAEQLPIRYHAKLSFAELQNKNREFGLNDY